MLQQVEFVLKRDRYRRDSYGMFSLRRLRIVRCTETEGRIGLIAALLSPDFALAFVKA